MGKKTLDLRPKQEGIPHRRVVHGLDAEIIARPEQLPLVLIPDDKGEHPAQAADKIAAVFLIGV